MTTATQIPIVILGGSGGHPTQLPRAGGGYHPLTGYKGVDLRIQGRALISHLVDRIIGSGAFGPIYVAGPERVYGSGGDSTVVIDTDGGLGDNVRAAVRHTQAQHPDTAVAFIACDVLPTSAELAQLADQYRNATATPLWFPLVAVAKEDLGAFAWKPGYKFRVEPSAHILDEKQTSITVFPGHLVIAEPPQLRMAFFYRLAAAVYAARNRSIVAKSRILITRLLPALIWEDLKGIFRGQAPTYAYRMLRTGIKVTRPMRDGQLTLQEAADALSALTVIDPAQNPVQLPTIDLISFAEDIDTTEEAHELGAATREEEDGS
ncbi:MAG: hypothetical protein AAF581_13170 [Planctomycetota bacterium]